MCDDTLQYSGKGIIMKKYLAQILLLLIVVGARGQGFDYDQQSATSDTGGNGITLGIQSNEPIGQSFIPSRSSVGFVRFFLFDAVFPNPAGATAYVNLWSGSIGGGTLMASTDPVFITPGFDGYANFFFSTTVPVNSGTTYYFQPLVQFGDDVVVGATAGFVYANGMSFIQGVAQPGQDLWFREGIVVPEPSSALLTFSGFVGFCFCRKRISLRH